MALLSGLPVVLSQTMVVSLWLVMPTPLSLPTPSSPSLPPISSRHCFTLSSNSSGSCSNHLHTGTGGGTSHLHDDLTLAPLRTFDMSTDEDKRSLTWWNQRPPLLLHKAKAALCYSIKALCYSIKALCYSIKALCYSINVHVYYSIAV